MAKVTVSIDEFRFEEIENAARAAGLNVQDRLPRSSQFGIGVLTAKAPVETLTAIQNIDGVLGIIHETRQTRRSHYEDIQ